MPPLSELGPLGQLLIREASFRICSLDRPNKAGTLTVEGLRQYWGGAPLRWCYERAGTILRAFPAARFR